MIQSSKEKNIKEGIVIESLPSLTFKVKLDNNREVLARLSGRMRIHHIRVLVGDKVNVELSPYDETKGRIVFRSK